MYCLNCKTLRESRGSLSITTVLKRWGITFNPALERRDKKSLTTQDVADAKAFSKKPNEMLKSEGRVLKAEAITRVDYISTMARLDK